MNVKIELTRKQELHFIRVGLEALAQEALTQKQAGSRTNGHGHTWTPAQHKKFATSMSKTWEQKKQAKAKPNGHAGMTKTNGYSADKSRYVKQKSKGWTPARRRQFALAMKRKGFTPRKTAGDLLREETASAIKKTIKTAAKLKTAHVGQPSRPGRVPTPSKKWTPEHRKHFIAAMKKKREEAQGTKTVSTPVARQEAAAT